MGFKRYYGNENHIYGQDLNILTKQVYKNIFELRHTKLHYFNKILPTLVKNTIIIRYEDLVFNFKETLTKIKNKGLTIKNNIKFPVNTNLYSGPYEGDGVWKPRNPEKYIISKNDIFLNINFNPVYEEKYNYYPDIYKLYKNILTNNKYIENNLTIEKQNTKDLNYKLDKLENIINIGINKILADNIEKYKIENQILKEKCDKLTNDIDNLNS